MHDRSKLLYIVNLFCQEKQTKSAYVDYIFHLKESNDRKLALSPGVNIAGLRVEFGLGRPMLKQD